MKKLLIDIGNSCVKWVFVTETQAIPPCSTSSANVDSLPSLFKWIQNQEQDIDSVWVSNVLGLKVESLIQDCWQPYSVNVHFVKTPSSYMGLTIAYTDPSCFGVDRFLSMLAVKQVTTSSFCCIDIGTAITLDVVNQQGQHLGGHILPGLRLFPTLLGRHTFACQEKDGMHELEYTCSLANQTQTAMQNGAITAVTAYLEYMMRSLTTELGSDVIFYLTGGDSAIFLPHLSSTIQHIPALVLQGLQIYSNHSVI